MSHFVLSAWVTFFSTSFLASLVFVKGKAKLHKIFSAYSLCIALWALCFTQHVSSEEAARSLLWSRPLHIFAAFIPVLFLSFTFTLIAPKRVYRTLLKIAAGGAIFFSGLSAVNSPLFMSGVRPRPGLHNLVEAGPLYPLLFAFFIVCATYGLWLIWRAYLRASGISQAQLRYLLLGSLLGYSGGIDNFLIVFDIRLPLLAPFGTYAIPLYVLIASYAIVRYRLMDINVVLARLATFILFYLPLLLLPIIGGNLLQPVLSSWLGVKWWIVPAAFEALFAVGGLAVYRYVQEKAENRVLAEQREYQVTLSRASKDMTRYRDMRKLLKIIVAVLSGRMGVSPVAVYLADLDGRRYLLKTKKGYNTDPPEPQLEAGDPLIRYLRDHEDEATVREELLLQHNAEASAESKAIAERLKQLGAECVIPSFSRGSLLGFLMLGAKRSGRMYTDDDLKLLVTLANQAALAVENARFYESESNRQAQIAETAKLTSLGVVASSIGHQFNNRFFMQVATATVLRDLLKQLLDLPGIPQEMVQKMIERAEKISENALQGGKIAEIVKDFAKPGKAGARFPLSAVLNTATEFARSVGKLEGFDFDTSVPDGLPLIRGNESQLADSFFNLISNASDAIKSKERAVQGLPGGGQPFRGKLQIKAVSFDEKGAPWLKVEVSDNGIGIQEEEFPNLFVPFFTTKDNLGTGLGLFTVKWFIEKHKGTVQVNSTYGKGTTFTIRLPGVKPEPKT